MCLKDLGCMSLNESFVCRGRISIGAACQLKQAGEKRPHHVDIDDIFATGEFNSTKLALFQKCFALHPVCNIYLETGYPLIVEILVNELGVLRLCLAHLEND